MTSSFTKFDADGHFTFFPGVTSVASCFDANEKFCHDLHQRLFNHPLIKRFFSILPASSFHMTTYDLFTMREIGEERWLSFIDEKLPELQKIADELALEPLVTIERVIKHHVIQLVVSLPEEQLSYLTRFAEKHELKRKMPNFFHMTLAYQFKSIPLEHRSELESAIQDAIQKTLDHNGLILRLGPARLCYFQDMTEFYPWDARDNPFLVKSLAYACRK